MNKQRNMAVCLLMTAIMLTVSACGGGSGKATEAPKAAQGAEAESSSGTAQAAEAESSSGTAQGAEAESSAANAQWAEAEASADAITPNYGDSEGLQPVLAPLELNDKWYRGTAALRDAGTGNVYYPLEGIEPYYPEDLHPEEGTDGQTWVWKDELRIEPDGDQVIMQDGLLYVMDRYLSESMGLNLYVHDGVRYVDNYPKLDYSWTKYRTVFHGCGGLEDKYTYTNSKEALLTNYEAGGRVFEIDFEMTADGVPVCVHNWEMTYDNMGIPMIEVEKDGEKTEEAPPLTLEEFKSHKIWEKYTPMTFEDVLDIMAEKEDMYVITDSKRKEDPEVIELFQAFVDEAAAKDITLLDRVIPQMYDNPMYDTLRSIYDWKSVVYTFYFYGSDFRYQDVYTYAREHGIKVFCTNEKHNDMIFMNAAADRGDMIYMHTLNEMEDVEKIVKENRAYGIYTDYLPADCMDEFPYPYEAQVEGEVVTAQ